MGFSSSIPRSIARLPYSAVRLPLALLDKHVVARYWGDEASLRLGFERFLRSLDRVAGQFLAGDRMPEDTGRGGAGAGASAPGAQAGRAWEAHAAGEPGVPPRPPAKASTVDVTFSLPAEIQADSVALCGEFNDWSAESIRLERGADGSWRATVPLAPGHSYRYRYLLDGERWENAWQADAYVRNAFGSDDSVILVE